jgi:predicted metalloendopeptidase
MRVYSPVKKGSDAVNAIDWDIVEKFIKEYKPDRVIVGMAQDWYWTACTVWEDGEWQDLKSLTKASNWATPWLEGEFTDGTSRKLPCSKEATDQDLEVIEQERKERRREMREFIESYKKSNPDFETL